MLEAITFERAEELSINYDRDIEAVFTRIPLDADIMTKEIIKI